MAGEDPRAEEFDFVVDAGADALVATPGGSWTLLESIVDAEHKVDEARSEQSELLSRTPSLEDDAAPADDGDDDGLAVEEARLAGAAEALLDATGDAPKLASPTSSRETSSLLKAKVRLPCARARGPRPAARALERSRARAGRGGRGGRAPRARVHAQAQVRPQDDVRRLDRAHRRGKSRRRL